MLWHSLVPPHAGMRQYWHDFDALERWARSHPHKQFWGKYLRDPPRHRLLARDQLPARRHRGNLRRHTSTAPIARPHARNTRDRGAVLGSATRRARRRGTRSHRPRSRNLQAHHAHEVPSSQPSRSRPRARPYSWIPPVPRIRRSLGNAGSLLMVARSTASTRALPVAMEAAWITERPCPLWPQTSSGDMPRPDGSRCCSRAGARANDSCEPTTPFVVGRPSRSACALATRASPAPATPDDRLATYAIAGLSHDWDRFGSAIRDRQGPATGAALRFRDRKSTSRRSE
jgi:hypothetical protein